MAKLSYEQAFEIVTQHKQAQLLDFYSELNTEEQESLLNQIENIDFSLMEKLYRNLVVNQAHTQALGTVSPLQAPRWEDFPLTEKAVYANSGMRALHQGKVAAFLVAGGQGSRLGFEGPKGMFNIGLPSGKSLFQLQAERLLKLSQHCGKSIPWYIMTSLENDSDTQNFFRAHNNFGYPAKDLFFFSQGQLPLINEQGKILLDSKSKISQGANGNGGCFLALAQSGALADMKKRGIENIFFYSVDNALVKMCDANFLGYFIHSALPTGSKAVAKAYAEEKVGVLCLREGRPAVLEYSDMPEEMIQRRLPNGELAFNAGNIAVHLFTRAFLEENSEGELPYHVAHKKIAFVDASGIKQIPSQPNAFKFELFMFDLFPKAKGMAALEVIRDEEFAPVKNKEGKDSPETARNLILDLHKKWALANGISENELQGKILEISPLQSFGGEKLNPSLLRGQIQG